jgi:predicted TIM-barrel fold metal-dependent hydrolase
MAARLIGQKLTEAWGQPVTIDNKTGATGIVGTEFVAKAPADGLTLLMGRLLDDFPNVTVQVVNLGGTLPFILERLEAVAESRNPETPFPSERLRRMVYDTASLGPRAIETAVRVIGADRLMLGTDYPIFRPQAPLDAIHTATITPTEADRVAGGTAAGVLRALGCLD